MVLPVSKATLSRVLRRHHINRLSSLDAPKPPVQATSEPRLANFSTLDIKKLAPLQAAGSARHWRSHFRQPWAGVESLHVAVDDHSRVAFASLFPDEKNPRACLPRFTKENLHR
jgi:hypothetical protein